GAYHHTVAGRAAANHSLRLRLEAADAKVDILLVRQNARLGLLRRGIPPGANGVAERHRLNGVPAIVVQLAVDLRRRCWAWDREDRPAEWLLVLGGLTRDRATKQQKCERCATASTLQE